MRRDYFNSARELTFTDLLGICEMYFGLPVVIGNHYIFETPWSDDPFLSIHCDGLTAKPYQVRIVREVLEKLEARHEIQ